MFVFFFRCFVNWKQQKQQQNTANEVKKKYFEIEMFAANRQ